MNLIHKTKTWLVDNNILVPDDWVTACIEWIQEEHQGVSLPQDQLNSLVYEQWLLADLHELETRCLPSSVLGADKYQLTGTFALQVDSIVDVGQSFYSQQQKVRGTENANVGVSADEQTLKPWEQKPTRMLMFKLTDGSQMVQGMEYKPIKCLSPQTQPGSKILVHGSVLCRHGLLMLSENNIKFLGGEVDTLVEANTQLNVLESAMEGSADHAGKSHRQEFEGSDVRPSQKPNTKTAGQKFGGHQNASWGTSKVIQSQGFVKQEPKVKKEVGATQIQQRANAVEEQWDDDQMFDALVDDMETDDFHQPQNSYSSHTNPQTNLGGQTRNPPVNIANSSRDSARATSGTTLREENKNSFTIGVNSAGNLKRGTSLSLPKKEGNLGKLPINTGDVKSKTVNSISVKRQKTITNQSARTVDDFFDDDDVDFAEVSETENMNMEIDEPASGTKMNCSSMRNIATTSSSTFPDTNRNVKNLKLSNSNVLLYSGKDSIQPVPKSESNLTLVHHRNDKMHNQRAIAPDMKIGISRFLSPPKLPTPDVSNASGMEKCGSDSENEYPFTYLSKVLSGRPSKAKIITVKAYISTLTSKLSSDSGRWSLSCKINDGTMACDVELSDKVLTRLIGFSTEDAKVMKGRAKTDKTVRDVLQKGIQQCQQKLIELMCLMEIDINFQNSKPTVVALKLISSNDIELLYYRVVSSLNKISS